MRVESLVYSGLAGVLERNVVAVKHGHLLVKPLYVYFGTVERAIFSGYEPLVRPVVIGSSGVVKVIEDPSGASSEYSGRIAVVSPIGPRGVLGIDVDGIASTYSELHGGYIYKLAPEARPVLAIHPYVAYGLTLRREAEGSTLIVGCDSSTVAFALSSHSSNSDRPDIICSRAPSYLRARGLKLLKHASDLLPKYDTVVVSFERYSLVHEVLSSVGFSKLVLAAFSRLVSAPIKRGLNAKIVHVDRIGEVEAAEVENVAKELLEFVRVHRVRGLSEVAGLLPPQKLGLIVEIPS